MRSMTFAKFVRDYKPVLRAGETPEDLEGDRQAYLVGYDEAKKHHSTKVWSVIDVHETGRQYLSPGFRVVNATGDYIVCAVPHDFPTRDVRFM